MKKILILNLIILILPILVLISPTPDVLAVENNLCEVDIDVVLLMDTSSSMEDGEVLSLCEWQELEWVGPSMQCVDKTENDLLENECLAKSVPPQCPSGGPTFTSAIPKKMNSAKDSANSFLNNLGQDDQSSVVSFNNNAILEKGLNNNHANSQSVINALTTGGETNIGDAIQTGITELNSNGRETANKVLILLTDGKANKPNGTGEIENADDVTYAESKAQDAADAGYKIFTVGLGSNSDINEIMLQNIANITGADYHSSPNGNGLSQIYDSISEKICDYGSISGCKYNDLNKNGILDDNEETLSNWEIVLTNGVATSTQITVDGCYTFPGLEPDDYTLSEVFPDGEDWMQTASPTPEIISLSWEQNLTQMNFLNYLQVCGNEIVDEGIGEQCDDGNLENDDGCSSTCQNENLEPPAEPVCGNLIVESGEECDDGPSGSATCTDSCVEIPEEPTGISAGDVVINEIMQNPSAVSDSNGEWFELYNTTDSDIDLESCVISDIDTDSHIVLNSLIIPANGYSVLARNDNALQNGGVDVDYKYDSFVLGNSDDEIVLTCDNVEIDYVGFDDGATFPDPSGASIILGWPNLDNNVGINWCESSLAWDGSVGDFGSPGKINESCGLEPTTGALKICKYEDEDGDINTCGDKNILSDWLFEITLPNLSTTTATTTQTGCFELNNLDVGEYLITENLLDGWKNISPGEATTTQVIAGATTTIEFYNFEYASVSGFKYQDLDGLLKTTDDLIGIVDWIINLFNSNSTSTPIATTTTDSVGYYKFENLLPDEYQIEEELQNDWKQLSAPENPFTLLSGENLENYNFINHYIGESEGGEETGGNGGGGGYSNLNLEISQEQSASVVDGSITITWLTNHLATSRVVYDNVSHPNIFGESAPNYGYQWSTLETDNDPMVTGHSVFIDGLTSGTYYFRPISHGSPEVYGDEIVFEITGNYILPTQTTTSPSDSSIELIEEPDVVIAPELPISNPVVPGEVIEKIEEINEEEIEQVVAGEKTEKENCEFNFVWWQWLIMILFLTLSSLSYHFIFGNNNEILENEQQSLLEKPENKNTKSIFLWLVILICLIFVYFLFIDYFCFVPLWMSLVLLIIYLILLLINYFSSFKKISGWLFGVWLAILPIIVLYFCSGWTWWIWVLVVIGYLLVLIFYNIGILLEKFYYLNIPLVLYFIFMIVLLNYCG